MNEFDSVTWVEQVKVLLSLLGQNGAQIPILIESIFHLVTNEWLGRQFDSCKFADAFVDTMSFWILIIDVLCSQRQRTLSRLRRNMLHLFEFQVLQECCPREEEVRSKLLDIARFGNLNLIFSKRLFLLILLVCFSAEPVMEVRAQIADQ